MIYQSRGLVRSHYKLNTLYLHFHKTNRHQILQGGDLPWGTFTHKVIWSFKQMVMWDRVTRWKQYISNSTIPITTKFFRMVTYDEGLQPIKSHDSLITWSHKFTWKIKNLISPALFSTFLWLWINDGVVNLLKNMKNEIPNKLFISFFISSWRYNNLYDIIYLIKYA